MSDTKMVMVVRRDLNMRKGKMVAQGGHSVLTWLVEANESEDPLVLHVKLSPAEAQWLFGSMAKVVVGCDSEDELEQLILAAKLKGIEVYKVTDEGRTEFHGQPTVTCAAFGPDNIEAIDEITGHLKLL